TGAYLHRLFEAAIHAGKRARTETEISQNTTSISHAAALLMHQESRTPNPKVMILGAGEMAELAVFAVHKYGLSHIAVLNRTYDKAQALADKYGVKAMEWSCLWEEIIDADVVITATGAPHTILHREDIQRAMSKRNKPLMLIDIAVPRDIANDVGIVDGVNLFDIDSLQHIVDSSLEARKACIPQVLSIIEDESNRYQMWVQQRAVVPVIKELRHGVQTVVQDELDQALNKLPDLSDDELAIVKRMAHRIMNKVLHAPTKNLRAHASDADVDVYTDIVRELFALETDESETIHPA
ncbi:MAG: glutamyl-tRNA reductase, partial [Chloroflexota bacterium]